MQPPVQRGLRTRRELTIDTYNLEHGLRCIPIGHRDWRFAPMDIGAGPLLDRNVRALHITYTAALMTAYLVLQGLRKGRDSSQCR